MGPSVPAAPARFSITIERPSGFSVAVASARITMSVVPPAGQGTINVTGREGKFCACATLLAAINASATARSEVRMDRLIVSPPTDNDEAYARHRRLGSAKATFARQRRF